MNYERLVPSLRAPKGRGNPQRSSGLLRRVAPRNDNLISELLQSAYRVFNKSDIDSPWLDAELLLAHTVKKDRGWLLAHPEHRLTKPQRGRFLSLLRCRAARVPLAYLTGEKEFYGRTFRVTRAVLIPRPETEQLIEYALPYLKKLSTGSLVADIGTGSGCIAITLARLLPHLQLIATDTSAAALTVARANARRQRVNGRIRFLYDRNFSALKNRKITAIISNLPYLSTHERNSAQPELLYEPKRALVAGSRGDEAIRALLTIANKKRADELLYMFLELNPRHALMLQRFAAATLANLQWNRGRDMANQARFLIGVA